jgi:succinate-acetate transporter protein
MLYLKGIHTSYMLVSTLHASTTFFNIFYTYLKTKLSLTQPNYYKQNT